MKLNNILLGDCLELMKNIPNNSIDMVFTSPPYAERRRTTYGGIPENDYVDWFLPIGVEIKRILKPTGSLFFCFCGRKNFLTFKMSIKDKYIVKSIPKEQTYEWILKKHYAGRIPSIVYSFGLYDAQILVGICTYGIPPQNNCLLLCGEEYKKNAIELNRLIKNDGLEKNVQSWFVAQTFEMLPKPMIVLSYADPNNGHYGYTYQALNFLYTGEGGADKEYVFGGYQYSMRHIKDYWFKANRLKFDSDLTIDQNFTNAGGEIIPMDKKKRYVIFLGNKKQKQDMRKKLIWGVEPYPKGQNERYDTSHKTVTQTSLF